MGEAGGRRQGVVLWQWGRGGQSCCACGHASSRSQALLRLHSAVALLVPLTAVVAAIASVECCHHGSWLTSSGLHAAMQAEHDPPRTDVAACTHPQAQITSSDALLLAHCRKLALALGTAAGRAGADGDRECVSPPAMGYATGAAAAATAASYGAGSLRSSPISGQYASNGMLRRSGSGSGAAYAAGKANAAAAAAGIGSAAALEGALRAKLSGPDGDSMSLRRSLGGYK